MSFERNRESVWRAMRDGVLERKRPIRSLWLEHVSATRPDRRFAWLQPKLMHQASWAPIHA